ncbi:MAG: hypothetical protein ACI8ZN_002306 [Bacteroidia bacterium]|jgi:hypothetical protein
MSGNHLIPIEESEISIQKEVLSITRIEDDYLSIDVQYEFFNPGEEKELLVGFEAMSPGGDVNAAPVLGGHAFMSDFMVELNGAKRSFDIAIVDQKEYFKNKVFDSLRLSEVMKRDNSDQVDFYYVYYFNAKFNKGLNKIHHTYRYKMSSSVMFLYDFEYILTAANRWANKGIDDFTLKIDMGPFADFGMATSFFTYEHEWSIKGAGKTRYEARDSNTYIPSGVNFWIRDGKIEFKKKNFKPAGELFLWSSYPNWMWADYQDNLDFIPLPFSIENEQFINPPTNAQDSSYLRNLPFARRGYVFKSQKLQTYFEGMEWYWPDPNYTAKLESLTLVEQAWVLRWK